MLKHPALPLRLVLLAGLTGLGACADENLSRTFGLVRDAPDEFRVTTRAPLSMPPEFTLRPPRPGAARPQEVSERQQAEQVLVPQLALENQGAGRPSIGQQALLEAAGPGAPQDIRQQVDRDARLETANRSLTDEIMFWRSPSEPGVIVDPEREAKRIRGNAALGTGPEQGDTPIIQRRRRSFFDSLF
jgi:hypothetical protein